MKKLFGTAVVVLTIGCREQTATESTTTTAPTETVTSAPPVPMESVTCTAAVGRLCPVDEGTRDASFAAFRASLTGAIAAKDEAKLLALVDPKIRTNFGGGGGTGDFKAQWKTSAADSPLWRELGSILELGGAFRGEGQDQSFWAPYVYAAWPDEVDAFEHVAALRAGVPVRAEPRPDANIVTTVDWAILSLQRNATAPPAGWQRVKTADGHEGWAQQDDVRSPIGYRAGFSKRSGTWKMDALVAGD
jgi:hypothetical protein